MLCPFSERADSTGATGDRLKEGAAINQSLSSLGNCIAGKQLFILLDSSLTTTNLEPCDKSDNKMNMMTKHSMFKYVE